MPAETAEVPDLNRYLSSTWLADSHYYPSKPVQPVAIAEGAKLPTPPEQNFQPTWSELPSALATTYSHHRGHVRNAGRVTKHHPGSKYRGMARAQEYYTEPTQGWYNPQFEFYDWPNMHFHHDGYVGLPTYPGQMNFHQEDREEVASDHTSGSKQLTASEPSPTVVSNDEEFLQTISPATSLPPEGSGAPPEIQLFLAVRDGRTSRAYTFEENEIIMKLKKGGVQWKDTAAIVPRTDKSLQVHFSQHLKETAQARETDAGIWDSELDSLLVQLVMKDSEVFWTNIEKQFRMKAASFLPKAGQSDNADPTASNDTGYAGSNVFNALNLRWRYLNLLEPCRMRVEEILREMSRARRSSRPTPR